MDEFTDFISRVAAVNLKDSITPLKTLVSETKNNNVRCKMESFFLRLQAVALDKILAYEPTKRFQVDKWERDLGGGGITCVLQDGDVMEKAGVNVSALWGEMKQETIKVFNQRGKNLSLDGSHIFFATGISCLLQPVNPFVPSIHCNYRYFEITDDSNQKTWWLGGNCFLYPNYVCEEAKYSLQKWKDRVVLISNNGMSLHFAANFWPSENQPSMIINNIMENSLRQYFHGNFDFIYFHSRHKKICDEFDDSFYPRYKKSADDYNYIKHRGEYCGIGGLCIDELNNGSFEKDFGFISNCACATLPTYVHIMDRHKNDKYSANHRNWQLIRRGRYVEHNLVYGRGTKYGLNTPGIRIESVLMCMPLTARWDYMYIVEHDSEEDAMMEILKSPRDWV